LNLLAERLHRNTLAYDDASGRELLLQIAVLQAKTFGVYRVFQQDECFVDGQGFF